MAAAERVDPSSEHGHGRVALQAGFVVELVEPTLDLGDPAPVVRGQGDRGHDPRHPIGVAGSLSVPKRRLGVAVLLEPVRRAAMQLDDELGLALRQLASEQIPKEGVTAVRLAVPVEGSDQEVRAVQ